MNDLDELLERAMPMIAAEMPVRPDLDDIISRAADPDRRTTPRHRRGPWLAAAAAGLVTVGVAGIWAVNRDAAPRSPADTAATPTPLPATTPPPATATVEPSTFTPPETSAAPETSAEITIPVPEALTVVDPSLGLGEPTRANPYEQWLYAGPDLDQQWLVRTDQSGAPTAGLRITTWPASEWTKSFNDGTPVDLDGTLDARIMADSAHPTIGWLTADGVRSVQGVGDANLDAVRDAARAAAATTATSDVSLPGFVPVGAPLDDGTVSYDSGVAVTINRPADTSPLDARTTVFMTVGNTEPLGTAWAGHIGDATLVVHDRPDGTQVAVRMPDDLDVDPTLLLASLQEADPDQVPTRTSPNLAPADATYEVGQARLGRWFLASWTGPDGSTCRELNTSFGGGRSECAPNGTFPPCVSINGWAFDLGAHFVLLVNGHVDTVTAIHDGARINATTIEHFGDRTLAAGSLPDNDSATRTYELDGTPTAC